EELEEDAPIVDLSPGDKRGEDTGAKDDYARPRQFIAREFQNLGQGRNARRSRLKLGVVLRRLGLGEAERKRSIHQKNYGGRDEDGGENFGFGHDDRAGKAKIDDCGKTQPNHPETNRGGQRKQTEPK